MKIGILTFHRAQNYGAILQCYALTRVLQSLGCNVDIIDYRNRHIENYYKGNFSWIFVFRCLLYLKLNPLILHLKRNLIIAKRRYHFESFRNQFFSLSSSIQSNQIPQIYDCYVIGSDQMWSIHCYGEYDPIYWGEFMRPKDSRLYGYAISANGDYRDYLSEAQICQAVDRFTDISFREQKVADDISSITGIDQKLALDPTLLTDISIWTPLLRNKWQKRKYVAVYHIRKPALVKGIVQEEAEEFASSHCWDVIDLSEMDYSVADFVSVIRYAQCVFTSSFHATVFSIIFRTPFWTFLLNDGHDNRCVDLLKKLGLSSHMVECNTPLEGIPIVEDCDEKMEMQRSASFEFLVKNFK